MTSGATLDSPVTRPLAQAIVSALATIAFVIAAGIWLAGRFHTDEGGTTAVVGGAALLIATLTRASWFWNHPKVLFVRSLIGDKGATVVYAACSIGFGLVGVNRLAYWKSAVAICSRRYADATDSHQRVRVLQTHPDVTVPRIVGAVGKPRLLTCERYRESGAFTPRHS